MPIFLFNYNSRQLHGIFRAVSDGDWKINPHGGRLRTPQHSLPIQPAMAMINQTKLRRLQCIPIGYDRDQEHFHKIAICSHVSETLCACRLGGTHKPRDTVPFPGAGGGLQQMSSP